MATKKTSSTVIKANAKPNQVKAKPEPYNDCSNIQFYIHRISSVYSMLNCMDKPSDCFIEALAGASHLEVYELHFLITHLKAILDNSEELRSFEEASRLAFDMAFEEG